MSVETLTKELRAIDLKIARLTASIEDGDAIAPIVAKRRERQTERDVLLREIVAAESMRALTVDRQVIERKVLAKMANWSRCWPGESPSVGSFSGKSSTGRSTSSRRATRLGLGEWTGEAERFPTS